MKKTIAYVLLLGLLACLWFPVRAADGTEEPEEGPSLSLCFDPKAANIQDAVDAAEFVASKDSRPTVRGDLEDNLIFPGPLTDQCSFRPERMNYFYLGALQTGKAGQYYCLLLYKGKEPSGDPVRMTYGTFGTEKGISTKRLSLDTIGMELGRYTVVTCTAERRNNTLYPIDGTAFMTDVYYMDSYQQQWQVFLKDMATNQRLNAVHMSTDEVAVLGLGRSPLPSDGQGRVTVTCEQGLVAVEEAGGILYLTPLRYGSGELCVIHRDAKVIHIPIHICLGRKGHKAGVSAVALQPTASQEGLSVNVCEYCDTVYREEIPSTSSVFELLKDVPENAWYRESVQEAVHRNLFKGVTDTAFQPDQSMTRAMLVTVLWRYEGEPEAAAADFADVPRDVWYTEAVDWAAEKGIVNGVGNRKFNPNGKVTREQMSAVLYRYAEQIGLNMDAPEGVAEFIDGGQVSSWALKAFDWAIANNIIGGVKQGQDVYLRPQADATRAQVSAILIRFIHSFIEPENKIELPDLSSAKDSGEYNGLHWAFYPHGLLQIGGYGAIPAVDPENAYPWAQYFKEITEVEILYGVEAVGRNAFAYYPRLQIVKISDSVKTISEAAFKNCPELNHVTLSENLDAILAEAFKNCSSLEEILLPNRLTRLGSYAFSGCKALKEVILPDSIIEYDHVEHFKDHYGIGNWVFEGCTALEFVRMPTALLHMGDFMFANCTSLKEVELPICVETIGSGVFYNCSSLESALFMPNIRHMINGAFTGCKALQKVYVLGDRVILQSPDKGLYYTLEDLPYGDPKRVELYGFVDSYTEDHAGYYGYSFKNIMEAF